MKPALPCYQNDVNIRVDPAGHIDWALRGKLSDKRGQLTTINRVPTSLPDGQANIVAYYLGNK